MKVEKRCKGEAADIRVSMLSLTMLLMASLELEKVQTWATHAIFLNMLLTLREESENQIQHFYMHVRKGWLNRPGLLKPCTVPTKAVFMTDS